MVLVLDPEGRLLLGSSAGLNALGVPADRLGAKLLELGLPVEVAELLDQQRRRVVEERCSARSLLRLPSSDGPRELEYVLAPVLDEGGEVEAIVCGTRDVTRERQAVDGVRRLHRLYAVLSETNKAIVRARSRLELFDAVCRIAVEQGGLRLSWVGLVEPASQRLAILTVAGHPAEYARSLLLSTDPGKPEGCGPAGRAAREGIPYVCNDLLTDTATGLWREAAREADLSSLAVFPLRQGDRVVGVLALYGPEPGYFDPDLVSLFEEMGRDLEFALEGLDREAQRRAAEERLERTVRWLEEAERVGQTGSVQVDPVTGETSWSDGAARILGLAGPALPGRWEDYAARAAHPEDAPRVRRSLQGVLPDGATVHLDHRIVRPDGSERMLRLTAETQRDADGSPVSVLGTLADVTERRLDEERQQLWAKVLESSSEAIVVTDEARRVLHVNRAFEEMTGYTEAEVAGQLPAFLSSDAHDQSFYEGVSASLQAIGSWRGEVWHRRKDGELFPSLVSITAVPTEGRQTHYVAIASDISERKWAAQEVEFLAHHDPLTRLPNRSLLDALLDQAIAGARREERNVALLSLDIDLFKTVNESLGHSAGDDVLKEIATRVAACLRGTDVLARPGGDEFLVVLPRILSPASALQVGRKLLEVIARPLRVGDDEVTVTASIGVAIFPQDGADGPALLKSAEAAMYQAKELGRNTVQQFAVERSRSSREVLTLENRLMRALGQDEFVLHYQPLLDLQSGRMVGAEALIRWHDPEQDLLVEPAQFIALAEERGLVLAIGEWVARTACRQAKAWLDQGRPPMRVAVNVSAMQLRHPTFEGLLEGILADTGLPPQHLELELTESVLMQDLTKTVERLKRLRSLGVALAIDDFGTGFSSLGYLQSLPIGRLKIDRSFVKDVWADGGSASIVRAVIALARSLGLRVIAEGVETRRQLTFLRFHGCDEVQGYLLGMPVPAAELDAFRGRPPSGEFLLPNLKTAG